MPSSAVKLKPPALLHWRRCILLLNDLDTEGYVKEVYIGQNTTDDGVSKMLWTS